MFPPSSQFSAASSNSKLKCCEFYLKNKWCKFEDRCRYAHIPQYEYSNYPEYDISPQLYYQQTLVEATGHNNYFVQHQNQQSTNVENVSEEFRSQAGLLPQTKSETPQQICRYYQKSSSCPFGSRCKFSHRITGPQSGRNSRLTKPESQEKSKKRSEDGRHFSKRTNDLQFNWRERKVQDRAKTVCQYYVKQGGCRNGDRCQYLHQQPETPAEDVTVAANTAESRVLARKPVYYIKDLNEDAAKELRELEISQMKKRIVNENFKEVDDYFLIKLNPTDPDWPYDIKEVQLRIRYPLDYPLKAFQVEINCEDNELLPLTLTKHIADSTNEWLSSRQKSNEENGKAELLFRPFILWFDRSLEELFTAGLKRTKRDIDAKVAGIEFVPFQNLPGFKNNTESEVQVQKIQTEEPSESTCTKENIKSATPNQTINDQNKAEPEKPLINHLDLLQITKKGTELKLCNLQLGEHIASIVCQTLQLVIQCNRCKSHHDISTVPRRKNLIPCTKCHQSQYVTFRPAMIHSHADILGYLDLESCQAFDLPLIDAMLAVTCLNCDKQKSATGIHYGQEWSTWCHNCHVKLELLIPTFKFQILQQGNTYGAGKVNVIKLEKKDKKVKDPAIQEGKPLPNNGTCKHYKKSYRWFRFPCCGKAFPCDLCHNEKELDHEMKLANKVICGFCCKEQPFSNKPCSTCSSSMTQLSKSHWEGGKGCRDKTKMSREDRQKYSGLNKTVAKTVKDRKEAQKS